MSSTSFARRVGFQAAGVVVVVAVAVLWGWFGGAATARLLRGGFAVLGPVLVLGVAAALLVVGVGLRLVPVGRRPRAVVRVGLLGGRLGKGGLHVSTVVVLSAIVALATLFRVVLGAANHTPKVLGDELIYSGLAKGWALHGKPFLRGSLEVGHSTLYPLFLAPAFRLAADGAGALAADKVINAILMALTAVPAFALARRVVPRGWALGVAALSMMVPWTVYSALTMTESLFYPVFVTYAAVLAWTLERPSASRQAATLGILAVLVGVRAQGLTVALGTLAAILVCGALEGGVVVALRRFLPTLTVLTGVLALGIAAKVAGVAVPTSSYNVVFDSLDRVGGMLKWGAWNVAFFELSLGVVALAALPVALRGMLRRGARPSVRSTGAVTLALSLSLLASLALLSASPYGLRVLHERNLFYVTPLVLTCMAHWLWGGLERPFWLSAGCATASVALAALLPQKLILLSSNNVDVPSASFFLALEAQIPTVPFRVWVILIAAVGAGTFLVAKRPLFPILTVVLAFAAVTTQVDYRDSLTAAQARALSWVDHTLPAGASANLVYLGVPYSNAPCAAADAAAQQDLTIWAEFFNTHIGAVEYVYHPNPRDGLASPQLTVRPGGRILSNGKPFEPAYLVIDSRQPLVGNRLARFDLSTIHSQYQDGASLTLWHVDPPLRFEPLPQPLPARADGSGATPDIGAVGSLAGGDRGRGTNLIPNGGFEANVTGWAGNAGTETVTRTTAQFASGAASMSIATGGSSHSGAFINKNITVPPKINYIFSFYVKGTSGQAVIPTLEWYAGASLTRLDSSTDTILNGSWQLITYDITSPEGIDSVIPVIVLSGTPTTTFYLDAVRLVVGGPGGCGLPSVDQG